MSEATAIATKEPAKRSVLMTIAARYGMEPAAFEATVRGTCGLAGATREEFAAFLMVANEYGLNPVTREIYAFPKKTGGIQPIVGIDGWLTMANSRPEFDGLEVEFEHDAGKLVSAKARVYRKDRSHPVVVTEYLAECVRSTDPWKMQHRMLRHKATKEAIRYAFGFAGVMDADEAEGIEARPSFTPEPRAVQELPPLSEAEWQKQAPAWRKAVEGGRKTPDEILALARTRWTVTDGQAGEILSLGVTVKPDGEIVEAVDRGDAWEPEAAQEGAAT